MTAADPWRALGLLVSALFLYWLFTALRYGFGQMALQNELWMHKDEASLSAAAVGSEQQITVDRPQLATGMGMMGERTWLERQLTAWREGRSSILTGRKGLIVGILFIAVFAWMFRWQLVSTSGNFTIGRLDRWTGEISWCTPYYCLPFAPAVIATPQKSSTISRSQSELARQIEVLSRAGFSDQEIRDWLAKNPNKQLPVPPN